MEKENSYSYSTSPKNFFAFQRYTSEVAFWFMNQVQNLKRFLLVLIGMCEALASNIKKNQNQILENNWNK